MFSNIRAVIVKSLSQDPSEDVGLDISSKKERIEFFFVVVLCGLLPVALLLAGIIPYSQRYVIMTVITLAIIVLEKRRKISWVELGFRKDNLKSSLIVNTILVLVASSIILIVASTSIFTPPTATSFRNFYIFYIIALAPIQELLFRSIVFAEFKRAAITRPITKILLSAVIFAIPHLIYRSTATVIVALGIGLIWGWIYDRYPNWLGVALSHSILGTVSIMVGLI